VQPATCDDIRPISAPGAKFQCPEDTHQYDPSQNKVTPPAEKDCCMVRCASSTHTYSTFAMELSAGILGIRDLRVGQIIPRV